MPSFQRPRSIWRSESFCMGDRESAGIAVGPCFLDCLSHLCPLLSWVEHGQAFCMVHVALATQRCLWASRGRPWVSIYKLICMWVDGPLRRKFGERLGWRGREGRVPNLHSRPRCWFAAERMPFCVSVCLSACLTQQQNLLALKLKSKGCG